MCNACDPCEAFVDFGCFGPCGNLLTGVLAPSSGAFRLVTSFSGSPVSIVANQTEGEEMVFPLIGLNECYTFRAKIYDASGDPVAVNTEIECFQFKTQNEYEFA